MLFGGIVRYALLLYVRAMAVERPGKEARRMVEIWILEAQSWNAAELYRSPQ